MFYTVKEVMELLGIGKSKAYEIINRLNKELEAKGYIVVRGKVSKRYFDEKMYG